MGIAEDLSRIQTAKEELRSAIEDKGVTVPASARIDGYAALVRQIKLAGPDAEGQYISLGPQT